jgi:hypothetical protein
MVTRRWNPGYDAESVRWLVLEDGLLQGGHHLHGFGRRETLFFCSSYHAVEQDVLGG